MKIELSKEDIEVAIKQYISVWFPAVDVEKIEFIRTKSINSLRANIEIKEKGE